MPTKRITVSVPVEVAARLERAAGRSRSISEWDGRDLLAIDPTLEIVAI